MKAHPLKTIATIVCGTLLSGSTIVAQSFLGQWDFNSSNLVATAGTDLAYADGAGGLTAQSTTFGTSTSLGVPTIAGTEAILLGFGANTNGMGYHARMPANANGGGSLVNEYTLVFDLLYPAASAGKIRPLGDVDASFGVNPGPELVVAANDGLAVSGGTPFGTLTPGAWHRVAIVTTPAEVRFFINGTKVGTAIGGGLDGKFAATPNDVLLLLGDTGTSAAAGFVNSIQFRDTALSDGKILALGGPSAAGIPQVIPPIPSAIQSWIPAGAVANRNTAVGAVINRGETTIDQQTIVLKLDNMVLVQPTITVADPLITISKSGLPPFSPGSTHNLEISYTDSLAGVKTFTHQFKAALLFEDFEGLALQDAVEEPNGMTNAWTPVPPADWSVDNSKMPGYGDPQTDGRTEWAGWTFAKKTFWLASDQQTRETFTLANGVLAIADPDEWDDATHPTEDENGNTIYFNSFLKTPPVSLSGVAPNSMFIKFDSSWRPEGFDDWTGNTNNQTATVTVSYDGGAPIEILRWDSREGGPFFKPDSQNEQVFIKLNNPVATNVVFTFGLTQAANDWWWAFDNLEINAGAVAPLITAQPASQLASAGSTINLNVTASGTEPLQYQWFGGGVELPNSNTNALTLANVQQVNAGDYYVVVSNEAGSATSATATLTLFSGEVTDGLVTHLKFDGNYTDASGRGNNGQAAGAPAFEAGVVGQGVRITSASSLDPNNYVTLGYPADLKFGSGDTAVDFSMAFWVRVISHGGDKPFISNKDWDSGSSRGFVLSSLDNGMKWNYRDDKSARRDSPTVGSQLNDGNWHHVAVTFDRSDRAVTFIDGQLVNANSIAPDAGQPIGSLETEDLGQSINLGQDGTGSYGSSIDMVMDDVGIWRRLLTVQEVAAIYNAGLKTNDLSQAVVGTPAIPPSFTQEPADASGYERDLVRLVSSSSGTPPLTYQWYLGNAPVAGATTATYTINSMASTNAGQYYVVVRNDASSITSRVATVSYLGAAPPAAVTGQWDFNTSNLVATVGTDLAPFDAAVESVTQFGTTASFGLPNIAGAPASVMYFAPATQPWGGYVMTHGAQPNAGGTYVNRYTIIYDVLYPASSGGTWRALLQTNPGNSGDGDLFVNAANGIGISGNYTGTVPTETWTRIVAVFDLPASTLRKYIDGVLVGTQTLGAGFDGRWSLAPTALLFADEDGETNPGYVNSIQFRNAAMSDAEVAALGGVTTDGIPAPGSGPRLSAGLQGSSLTITWAAEPGVKLQRNSAPVSTGWEDVPNTTGVGTVTLPVEGTAGFFRLVK